MINFLEVARRYVRPRAANDPLFMAVLTVLCEQIAHFNELALQVALLYSLNHERAPFSILDKIGALLQVSRLATHTKSQYIGLLRAQLARRASCGDYDSVKRLANLLRKPGTSDEAIVSIIHPEALEISIPNASPSEVDIFNILIGAVQETTWLDAVVTKDTGGGDPIYLELSVEGKGLGKALT